MTSCSIIYGTAWKKDRTASLVVQAVLHGFRAIDTAAQLKHYREDLVGQALEILQTKHGIKRESIFLQTKLVPSMTVRDRRQPIPYNPSDPVDKQVKSSVTNSLENLRTTYLDSVLLHSPLDTLAQTLDAWNALIALRATGKVRCIGVSNTYDVGVLQLLEQESGHKVEIVQNRWFEGNQWDREVSRYCRENGIQYQSFWTLSGSPNLLAHPSICAIAHAKACTPPQVLFKLAQSHGITPLSGTTNEKHMKEDVDAEDIDLSLGTSGPDLKTALDDVRQLVWSLV